MSGDVKALTRSPYGGAQISTGLIRLDDIGAADNGMARACPTAVVMQVRASVDVAFLRATLMLWIMPRPRAWSFSTGRRCIACRQIRFRAGRYGPVNQIAGNRQQAKTRSRDRFSIFGSGCVHLHNLNHYKHKEKVMPANDDVAKLSRHLEAIENELNHIWALFGMREPIRRDTGVVRSARADDNRRIFEH